MAKALLIIEDYSELNFINGLFRKMGFETETLMQDIGTQEKILSLHPDLILISTGKKIQIESLAAKIHSTQKLKAKILYLVQTDSPPTPHELTALKPAALCERPVNPQRLFETIGRLLSLDAKELLDKLLQFSPTGVSDVKRDAQIKEGKSAEENGADRFQKVLARSEQKVEFSFVLEDAQALGARVSNYKTDMSKFNPQGRIRRFEARNRAKEMTTDWNKEQIQEIDQAKQEFTKALFKK